jgi:hypothetical protein
MQLPLTSNEKPCKGRDFLTIKGVTICRTDRLCVVFTNSIERFLLSPYTPDILLADSGVIDHNRNGIIRPCGLQEKIQETDGATLTVEGRASVLSFLLCF